MNDAVTKFEGAPAPQVAAADPMLSMIERVMMAPDLPIERITAIMDMRERQMNKEAEQVFNRAFAEAMAEMPTVRRTGENSHLRRKYATLDDLINTARPVLSRHGLSLNWQTTIDGQNITVTAIVRHAQGHSISTSLSGPRDQGKQMNALQAGGSTETYLKRYSGFSILGLSSGDEVEDDGVGADGTITEEQYVSLRDLLERAEADEQKLLDFFKIDHLAALPAKAYARADAILRRKIAEKGAK